MTGSRACRAGQAALYTPSTSSAPPPSAASPAPAPRRNPMPPRDRSRLERWNDEQPNAFSSNRELKKITNVLNLEKKNPVTPSFVSIRFPIDEDQ